MTPPDPVQAMLPAAAALAVGDLSGARCAGSWWLFDSTDIRDHQEARKLCAECPVIAECRRMYEASRSSQRQGNPVGTWAGRLYGRVGAHRHTDIVCGTDQGYHRHRSQKQSACEECKAAHAAAQRKAS